jgi:hypothetical protein
MPNGAGSCCSQLRGAFWGHDLEANGREQVNAALVKCCLTELLRPAGLARGRPSQGQHDRAHTDRYDLMIRAGHRSAVIGTTRNHLFFDLTRHRWVRENGALDADDRSQAGLALAHL